MLIFFGGERTRFEDMCFHSTAPGVVGLREGPGAKWKDLQYDHLHLPTSLRIQAAQAEADGTLKRNPALKKYLDKALAKMKGREEAWPHIDYQKELHPSTLDHRKDLLPKI